MPVNLELSVDFEDIGSMKRLFVFKKVYLGDEATLSLLNVTF